MALQKQVITAGGADRSYLVAGPPPGAPVSAVILSLHGTRSTADRQARLSGFGQFARTEGAVVVFPQAIEPIGTGYEWDLSHDVGYIAALATELLSRHRTPHGRVLLTGMSGGARMSSRFASNRTRTFVRKSTIILVVAPWFSAIIQWPECGLPLTRGACSCSRQSRQTSLRPVAARGSSGVAALSVPPLRHPAAGFASADFASSTDGAFTTPVV